MGGGGGRGGRNRIGKKMGCETGRRDGEKQGDESLMQNGYFTVSSTVFVLLN